MSKYYNIQYNLEQTDFILLGNKYLGTEYNTSK